MHRLLLLFFLSLFALQATATHNRAGEITYRHISGLTYEITIATCTKSSVDADREWLTINWGDITEGEILDSLQRDSIVFFDDVDAQRNVYIGLHTYSGPGTFIISVLDQNRNGGVINIPGSIDTPICFVSELIISPEFTGNNSVVLLNPPKALACLNRIWVFNPGGYDADGDILKYSLVPCRGELCEPIQGYLYPDESTAAADTFVIDENNGTVTWDAASYQGEYNFAILVEEFREINGVMIKVGSVLRDMQIDVDICDNNPPEITTIIDTCILINQGLQFDIEVSDPDNDPVSVSAIGGPLTEVENQATFNPSTNSFFWNPDCEEVQEQPHQVVFVATDNNFQNNLQDIAVVNIQVIAPAVENPTANPEGNTIALTWTPNTCLSNYSESQYDNFNYKIYRRADLYGYNPSECETGVPSYTGYELIATVNGIDTDSYIDDNLINYGTTYCYMIVTCWPNGAESIASEEVCSQINKVMPIMTNVSVETTHETNGENYIAWSPPTEIDSTQHPAPYQYKLYWSPGINSPSELIYESSLGLNLHFEDTTFTHSNIDTRSGNNTYHVEFYSNDNPIITSSLASSIFLTIQPDDNQLILQLHSQTPWVNHTYEIYRLNSGTYELIGTTTDNTYTDNGLQNQIEYCYYVKSIATYNDPSIVDPIINLSQTTCAKPVDLTPPCAPTLTIDDYCEEEYADLSWTNPNIDCLETDDVTAYNLYYSPTLNGIMEIHSTFTSPEEITFTFNENGLERSIAGCYYVTALDSLAQGLDGIIVQNESEPSNIICIDNCPEYELPNIFTPNIDGKNDLFTPFPYLSVDSVDFKVYSRWGDLVFETTDPDLNWDGKNMVSGNLSADGTYYYTIKIYLITLQGLIEDKRSGYIQLLGSKNEKIE